jgi:exopolysaccharide production protein ExoZ
MLVVVLHARQTLSWLHRPTMLVDLLVSPNGFGGLGVDMFFVISGAVMGMALKRDCAPGAFLRARFLRVVPLFWLSAILTISLSLLLNNPVTIERLANSITIFPILDLGSMDMPLPPVGWTLAFELYFYLIVSLALYLPRHMRLHAVLAALVLCALIGGELSHPIKVPLIGIGFNAVLLEFAAGLVALEVSRTSIMARHAPLAVMAGAGPLLYSTIFGSGFSGGPEALVAGLTGIVRTLAWGFPSAMLLAGLIARPDRTSADGACVRFGDASYAVYLAHWPVMMLLPNFWPWTGEAANILLFIMLIVAGSAAGLLAHPYIEQPLLARLRQKHGTSTLTDPLAI